ncbi:hypothetical protein V5O48_000786 [Marasmius crinis-equi]|uniref:Serine/threonine-protein phosphatase 1 regulatory subunit 10 n=1 Tax=Marasmius crinis-equi TaxID=585013 RepID=A0ABR3G0M5_9AGAR
MPSLAADGQRARPTSAVDDWTKDRSTPSAATPGPSTSSSLDINDLISDIGATPSGSPPSSFYGFQTPSFYSQPGPYNTMPYGSSSWSTPAQNSLPLSSYSSLNGATSSGSGSSSQMQHHQSQPHVQVSSHSPTNEQTMVIDPALTSMSSAGAPTNKIQQQQHHFSQSPPPQAATSSQYPYSSYSSLAVPASFMSFYPQQHAQQQQAAHSPPPHSHSPPSQGTLSPQALHASSPPPSLLSTISPSQFYGNQRQQQPQQHQQPQQPPASTIPPQEQTLTLAPPSVASGSGSQQQVQQGPTPEQRKQQLTTILKPQLQSSSFTGAQAVKTLVQSLENFGIQDVDPALRLEILTKIRDGAGNHYFRAWSENSGALDITREWLKAAHVAKEGDPLAEATMPLLHIIDRLPLTVESLRNSKLGKVVVKIVKDPPTPAIKDMASNVERRWRQLVEGASKVGPTTNGNSSNNASAAAAAKKRKLSEPAKPPTPAKRAAVGTSKPTSLTASSSTTKSGLTGHQVKDAKSDSSFFSAPKPKPKLPTFKKAAVPPVKKELGETNVAQPSSIDPFQEALKSMGKARTQSPVTTVTPPTSTPTPTATTGLTKSGKKKKSVTWAPESKLESVKLIDRAVYDDDPVGDVSLVFFYASVYIVLTCTVQGVHHNSLRDLDRGEGAALHQHLFEETVDWSDPIRKHLYFGRHSLHRLRTDHSILYSILSLPAIEIPADIEKIIRGEGSQEKTVQAQREQTALIALYLSDSHIPDTPGETTNLIDADEQKDICMMTCGPEVDEMFFSGEQAQQQQQPPLDFASVADLVAQLASGNAGSVGMGGVNMNSGAAGGDAGAGIPANGFNNANGHGGMPNSYIVFKPGNVPVVSVSIMKFLSVARLDPMAAFQQQLSSLSQDQVQTLLQQFNPNTFGPGGGQGQPYSGESLAGGGPGPGQYSEYGHHDDSGSGGDRPWSDTGSGIGGRGGGRGGGRFRGRGRGGSEGGFRHNKRKPCSFFQSGRRANLEFLRKNERKLIIPPVYRCKYGDQCDFAHELIS